MTRKKRKEIDGTYTTTIKKTSSISIDVEKEYSRHNPRRSKRVINRFSSYPPLRSGSIKKRNSRCESQHLSSDTHLEGQEKSNKKPRLETYQLVNSADTLKTNFSVEKENENTLTSANGEEVDTYEEMFLKNAFLLKFHQPVCGSTKREHIKWFEQIQQTGLLVTTNGCMLPHKKFSRWGSSGKPPANRVAAFFFHGPVPKFKQHPKGWSTRAKVSHRCHRKECINPSHFLYEPQWKREKRMFCGDRNSCDCGIRPRCIAVYHDSQWDHNDEYITKTIKNHEATLMEFVEGFKFELLDFIRRK